MKWTVEYVPRYSKEERKDRKPYVCYSEARCFNPCRKSAKGIDRAMINGDIKDIDPGALEELKKYRARRGVHESQIAMTKLR
ncbi:MAG: hypothetical protein ABIB79_01735 [archaeon]